MNENETPKPVVPQSRKGEGKMTDEELQSIVAGMTSDAIQLIDNEISPARAKATDYYHGELFGNEEDGRSQVVITEVRDVVRGIMPSMLRLFFGPDRVVELSPRTAKGVQSAAQATDYIQYVFAEDNRGFLLTHDVLTDGFVRKLGIFKWGWDDSATVRAYSEEGVTEDELNELALPDEVDILRAKKQDDDTYKVDYTVTGSGRPRIWALPPEEFIYDREARSLDDATFVGHRREMTRGDLIAMGVSEEILEEHGQRDARLESNVDAIERRAVTSASPIVHNPDSGEANDKILYVEGYWHLDCDGDGKAELRKICTVGPGYFPVENEPVSERPFSLFTPVPEPHTLMGQSEADLTMDLQLIKSMLVRGMLDSFALSVYPRTAFLDGFASVEDILNNEIGAPIRMMKENAVVPFSHPFTGEKAMGILEYIDGVSENRTGRSKGAMSLDSDALQSSTKQAVNAAVTASQEAIELVGRLFAEQALKPMFRGLYRMLVQHKPEARLVKLRGTYQTIDTTLWEADMDVTVNVALGMSDTAMRLDRLTGIAEKQEQLLSTLGPSNPICTMAQYANTLRKMVELSGYKDPSEFFNAVDPNWQPPQQAPQMSPEQTLAQAQLQIEQMRTQKDLQIKQAELTLKQAKQQHDMELEVRKLANDFVLRRYQIDAQFKAGYTEMDLEHDARMEEAALTGAMSIVKHGHEVAKATHAQALAEQAQQHEQGLAQDDQAHSQEMDQRAADAADAQAQAGASQGASE